MSRFRDTHSAYTMRAFWRDAVRAFGDTSGHCSASRGLQVGLGICYDVRFPELAQIYRRHGCELLVYPGAFNMTTGNRNRTASARAVPCLLSPSVAPATRYRSGQVALGCGPCGHGTPPVVCAHARTSRAQARIASRVCCACARSFVCGVRACASMYVLDPTHATHATRTTHDRPDPTLRVHPSARQGRRIGSF